jgi:hypothetical protein
MPLYCALVTAHVPTTLWPPPFSPPPPPPVVRFAIQRDPIGFVNQQRTLDPSLATLPPELLAQAAPEYTGMQHPPPARAVDPAQCHLPWEAPFIPSYAAAPQYGRTLQLTMCNW